MHRPHRIRLICWRTAGAANHVWMQNLAGGTAKPVVLVTGATGKVGFATCKALCNQFSLFVQCRAGVHNPIKAEKLKLLQGIETCRTDSAIPETFKEAFLGVERCLIVAPNVENRVAICKFMIDAAKAAGVNFICFQSMILANTRNIAFGKAFGEIEDYLKDSGIPYCILRTNLHMENVLAYRFHIKEHHELVTPLDPDTKISYISADDIGLAAATILCTPIGHEGKTYMLTGPEAISQRELCDALGSAVGEVLQLRQISYSDRYKYLTKKRLLPDWQVRGWEEVLRAAEKRAHPLADVHRDFETICHVHATSFAQWLLNHVDYFRAQAPAIAEGLSGVDPSLRDALTRQQLRLGDEPALRSTVGAYAVEQEAAALPLGSDASLAGTAAAMMAEQSVYQMQQQQQQQSMSRPAQPSAAADLPLPPSMSRSVRSSAEEPLLGAEHHSAGYGSTNVGTTLPRSDTHLQGHTGLPLTSRVPTGSPIESLQAVGAPTHGQHGYQPPAFTPAGSNKTEAPLPPSQPALQGHGLPLTGQTAAPNAELSTAAAVGSEEWNAEVPEGKHTGTGHGDADALKRAAMLGP